MPGIFQCCFVVYRLIRINNNDNSLISPCRQITGYQLTTVDWSCLEWWNKLIGTQYGLQQTISLYQFSAALVQAVVFKQSQKQISLHLTVIVSKIRCAMYSMLHNTGSTCVCYSRLLCNRICLSLLSDSVCC